MAEKIDRFDIEVALKNREFELALFWQRSNYFLVLNTALGVAAFSADDHFLGVMISCFGLLVSWLWFRTNAGSRFWQVFWETEVNRLAPTYQLESFELSSEQARERVRADIATRKSGLLRRWIDQAVLAKPSVTMNMLGLSLAAMLFWISVAAFHALHLPTISSSAPPTGIKAAISIER